MAFTYRCLSCGKQHSKEGLFEQAFQTKCLRCSHPFTVAQEMVVQTPGENGTSAGHEAITTQAAPGKSHAITQRPANQGGAADTAEVGIKLDEELDARENDRGGKRSKSKRRLVNPAGETSEAELEALDGEDATEEEKEAAMQAVEAITKDQPGKKKKPPKTSAADKEAAKAGRKKRLLVLAAIILPVLLIAGVGGYLIYNKSKAKKPVAKSKKKTPPQTPVKKEEKPAVVKAPDTKPVEPVKNQPVAFTMSAARLAGELAANGPGTDSRYKDTLLQVSGIFSKIEIVKPAAPPPPKTDTKPAAKDKKPDVKDEKKPGTLPDIAIPTMRAVFRTERATIACDLTGALSPDMNRWQELRPGEFFTTRGKYSKGGVLTRCLLVAPVAVADAKYAGKTIDLTGVVEAVQLPTMTQPFPTIKLEGETNSTIPIRCVFKKDSADDVKKVSPGSVVTIQGEFAGRMGENRKFHLQLDNCRFIDTTGSGPDIPRLAAIDLSRAYEEDVRAFYIPPRGKEERIDPPLTVTGLSKEWKSDPKRLDLKYRYRLVTVSGRLDRKGAGRVVLESQQTDQPLKVACYFSKQILADLADAPEYRIQGFCGGLENQGMLRLDNCTVEESFLKTWAGRLTADYLPHKPGITLVYDFAAYPPAVTAAQVERQVWYQRDGGITEIVLTHSGRLTSKSLLTHPVTWIGGPRRIKKGRVPLQGYIHKQTPGLVEFGQRPLRPGTPPILVPVLKLGIKAGETWEWSSPNTVKVAATRHVYTLEKFDTYRDRPCAIVKEVIVSPVSTIQQREIRHVYVKGLGEVQRQTWLHITTTEKRLILEMRMVLPEDIPIGTDKKSTPKTTDKTLDTVPLPKKE